MDALLVHAQNLAQQTVTPYLPIKGRIAYVVSHGQSYASNGYAIRTQGIAKALNQQGLETLCFVRPGRPWELGVKEGSIYPEMVVDGVKYIHSRWTQNQSSQREGECFEAMVEQFVKLFKIYRPQVVLAASNHEVGLPALTAARLLGLPFQYEVRGFWEISRASREPSWEQTAEFKKHHDRESWVCNNADALYTLNPMMKQELRKRGAKSPIRLVPNSVAEIGQPVASSNLALRKKLALPDNAFVLGYVGAITQYEGLEQLIEAVARLKDQNVYALVVGGYSPVNNLATPEKSGIVEELRQLAAKLQVTNRIIFTGRVEPSKLPSYFSAMDATIIPRRPLPVCELVSAIKPLEYLATGKPLIASDVAPQANLLEQGRLGWLFTKGNVDALVDTVKKLINTSTEDIHKKTSAARKSLDKHYTWGKTIRPMVQGLNNTIVPKFGPRIACIMDDFTYQSYSPEADFFQLTPEHWWQELEDFEPELLFIESAWRGKDELWGSKVGHKSQEVQGIIKWCNDNNIPTLFWNKEDPVHFETFLNTAKLFDHIFTTDLDCIHRYKAALGHNRVYFLPFACQPKLTNPIETFERKDAFCFAGAYYVRYPDRTKDLESFVEEFPKFKPLEIYDRNYGKDDPNYQFPDNYQPYIVGTLPFSEIEKAYKGYRYAINLNSIKQSQTMFARRVYELLGSNTITVSNFSRGVRLMFGELVQVSDSGAEIVSRLNALEENSQIADKYRLAGLRKILREHTYQDRLNYLLTKVTGKLHKTSLPSFTIISPVENNQQLKNTIANFKRQKYVEVELFVVLQEEYSYTEAQELINIEGVATKTTCLNVKELANKQLREITGENYWAAAFSPQDYYGPNYLTDLALATRFTDAPIIGKASYYQAQQDELILQKQENAYKNTVEMPVRASVQAPSTQEVSAESWVVSIDTSWHKSAAQQAVDSFNYAWDALSHINSVININTLETTVDDGEFDEGIPLNDLTQLAENTVPTGITEEQIPSFSAGELYNIFENPGTSNIEINKFDEGIHVASILEEGKHEYVYVRDGKELPIEKFLFSRNTDRKLYLHLEMTPGINLSLVLIFLDGKGQRLSHSIIQANKNNELEIPEGTINVRLGYRVYQSGEGTIKKLILGNKDLSPPNILGRNNVLLLTNNYPSYNDLYRNGFVHSRVKAYQERNVGVDILRFRKDLPVSWHEFQNVDVTTGSKTALHSMLESGRYENVLIHFLDEDMWSVLKNFINNIRMVVWVHGADIQPWYRRKFNIETSEQEITAKVISEKRMAFWRGVLSPMHRNLQIVFVSNYFAEEVMEDIGFRLPREQYHIIHNPINTDLFKYHTKDPELRKKILSIRPFSSRVYANDLTVKCILELSKESFFEKLEFKIIGDGKLFEETLEPLRKFKNVIIERKFMSQQDIAYIHKDYGVFLCPSRMDTQGVSRDEAMSSGLVPVTNSVGAIPEFLCENNALVNEPDDYIGIANSIKEIVKSEYLFSNLSLMASKSIIGNRDVSIITEKELSIFYKKY